MTSTLRVLPLGGLGEIGKNMTVLEYEDRIVLVDCGVHEPGSLANLERALAQCNLRLEHVRLLVCTHAHSDHYGQAATVLERAGCELWMHPDHAHATAARGEPEEALARRLEVARQSGVPQEAIEEPVPVPPRPPRPPPIPVPPAAK